MTRNFAGLAFSVACACTPGGEPEDTAVEGANTVTIDFSVSNGVRSSPSLTDPLVGTVYGSLFL